MVIIYECYELLQASHSDLKSEKIGRHFFSQGKVRDVDIMEKSGKITQNTEKVRKFRTNVIYYF